MRWLHKLHNADGQGIEQYLIINPTGNTGQYTFKHCQHRKMTTGNTGAVDSRREVDCSTDLTDQSARSENLVPKAALMGPHLQSWRCVGRQRGTDPLGM